MTIINSNEFFINQEKYFDMALNEDVYIRKNEDTFQLMRTNADNETVEGRVYYEPDADFYRSITMDEFKKRALVMTEKIDKIYAKK
jgi:hypothetical protein